MMVLSGFYYGQGSQKELNRKAIDYFQIENYDSALYYFNELISYFPNDTMAYLDRALTKEMLNDYPGSIADYSRIVGINPFEMDAYFLRGTAFYHLGFMDAALADFNHFIISENDNAYAYYFIGKIFLYKNQTKLAKKYFELAVFNNPSHSESLYELAKFEENRKNHNAAIMLLNKSIDAFPNGDSYKLKCIISYRENKFTDAAWSFEQLSKLKSQELADVVLMCNHIKKNKQLEKFFLNRDATILDLKTVLILKVLNGDFEKVGEIFSKLPNEEKEKDFLIFLSQLTSHFSVNGN